MVGNQVAGDPSNTVIARYDPEIDPTGGIQILTLGPEYYTPLYEVQILDYTPGAIENPNSWGCVEFVKVDPGSIADQFGYDVGDIACPEAYTGEGDQGWSGFLNDLGSLGGWLEEGLNYAAQAWQDIKDFAIDLVLKYTPLGWQCQFAEDVVLPEGTCKDVFAAAVDIGLASMGIPPSIPNFDQLMDQGMDYAVELAAQEVLENSPIPCVGPCEDAVKDTIRQAMETGLEQIAGQSIAPACVSEQEAHDNGREPWCPPPGAVVRPAMGAVDSPPTILVRLHRRDDVPDPATLPTCRLQIGAEYTLHDWYPGYPEFSTSAFQSASLPVPPLSPGETIDVAVALNQRNVVDLPWKSYLGNPYVYHDWGSMVYYGTSHAWASANFLVPPGYQYWGGPPSPCAPEVTSSEVGSQSSGWE
jgi:hypothetical protein